MGQVGGTQELPGRRYTNTEITQNVEASRLETVRGRRSTPQAAARPGRRPYK